MARNQIAELGQGGTGSLLGGELLQCIAVATSEFATSAMLMLAAFAGTLAAELIRSSLRRRRSAVRPKTCSRQLKDS